MADFSSHVILKNKRVWAALLTFCLLLTALSLYVLGVRDLTHLQDLIQRAGVWAPALFIVVYVLATSCLFPSTPLNLLGGAVFGLGLGLLWSSLAAVTAAVLAFAFTKTVGRGYVERRLSSQLQALDAQLRRGGRRYVFAVRLLPVIPHGVINYGAGLTSMTFTDYLVGTVLGTVIGVFPPVLLGSTGLKAVKTGSLLPFALALGLTGLLIASTTWLKNRRDAALTE